MSFSGAINTNNNLSIIQMTSQDCQTAVNQIAVGVVDMFLYLYVENYDDVVNKSYDFEFWVTMEYSRPWVNKLILIPNYSISPNKEK